MCTSNNEPKPAASGLTSGPKSTGNDKTSQSSQFSTPKKSLRLKKQQLTSLLLDSATSIFVIHYISKNPSYLNPWEIPNAQLWVLGFILIRCAIVFYDHLVVFLIEKAFKCKVLPTRGPGAPPVRYVELDTRSVVYLSLNSLNEYTFVMRLTYYLWNGGYQGMLPWSLSQLSLGNTIIAMGIMFVAMDLLYAPLHHFLHLPSMYPLIHKHHHRQHFPVRGYLDAGNEHPIEHMIGVMCTWFAVCTAEVLLPTIKMLWEVVIKTDELPAKRDALASLGLRGGGVHTVTVLIFFQLHAALAMMNHSPFDAQFSLPFVGSSLLFGSESSRIGAMDYIPIIGKRLRRVISGQWFRYSVGHHEMHHRKFNYNYAQYCLFYDHWMGTFIPYEGPKTASELEAKKKTKSS
jgi:sterol desaturase/sphingolipid hydroxylase (fatty acid hydroxylase superfamily)